MMTIAAFFGGKRRMFTTYTSNGSWVAPATTNSLESLTGQGSDGTAAPVLSSGPVLMSTVTYSSGFSGVTGGNIGWSALNSNISSAVATVNGGGTGTVFRGQTTQGASSYTYTNFSQGYTDVVAGSCTASYTGSWGFSGSVAASGDAYLTWSYFGSATNGTASTAFGYTFPGGVGGPAVPAGYSNIPVTPGNSYPIVVPTGGSVTVVWFE